MPQTPSTRTPAARRQNAPANPPAHEIRHNGVRATIWKNDTPKGARFNTTFERYYRDGEEWKSSDVFGRDDLLTLGFVAQEALRWIIQQQTPIQTPEH